MSKIISEKMLSDFAAHLRRQEREGSTVEKYRRETAAFARWLEGRAVGRELAVEYKHHLTSTRTAAGVNGAVSALNSLFSFMGLHDCKLKALRKAANVAESKVFPHNLRHLFARTYYQLEKDIVRLADILGHSSVNTTRIYTMESGETHRRMLERMKLVI